jgi:hypothetical protein
MENIGGDNVLALAAREVINGPAQMEPTTSGSFAAHRRRPGCTGTGSDRAIGRNDPDSILRERSQSEAFEPHAAECGVCSRSKINELCEMIFLLSGNSGVL